MSFSAVAAVWIAVGRVVGRMAGWTPASWTSNGAARVLVIAPHPDDEIGCGGALLLHHRAGHEVHLVHVTDGRGSRAHGLGPEEMVRRRRLEAATAAPLLGIDESHWIGLREWEWQEDELVEPLADRLRTFAPDIIYAPSRVDFHPEHVRVARSLARALDHLPGITAMLRVYSMHVPLTPVLANLVAPIQPVVPTLSRALRTYSTQLASLERCERMKRYAAACYGLEGHAEEFWQLDARAYARVHRGAAPEGPHQFRGVRQTPFTDPLSYLTGSAHRASLRLLAQPGPHVQVVT